MRNLKKIGAVMGVLAILALSNTAFAGDPTAWMLCKLTGDPIACMKAALP